MEKQQNCQSLYFLDNIILRTPLLPITTYHNNIKREEITANKKLIVAIYFSSQVFYNVLIRNKRKLSKKEGITLTKYFLRAVFRCTPFGLLAGCSVLNWGHKSSIFFNGEKRKTRLNFQVLNSIYIQLLKDPSFRETLTFYPNNTLYPIDDKNIRYIEYTENGKRIYKISELHNERYLNATLQYAKCGKTVAELIGSLITKGVETTTTKQYIDHIIDNKILISELEPNVLGEDYFERLNNFLTKKELQQYLLNPGKQFKVIETSISASEKKLNGNLKRLKNAHKILSDIGVDLNGHHFLHTDLYRETKESSLNSAIKESLRKGIEFLSKWTVPNRNINLNNFINQFEKVYGEVELPLLKVMDPEAGLGYPVDQYEKVSSLMEGIRPEANENNNGGPLGETDQWLLTEMSKPEGMPFSIDIEKYNNKISKWKTNPLCQSFSVIFRVIDFESNNIFIESIGNSSASNLLSRFSYLHTDIEHQIVQINEWEQAQNPDFIFAEVNYFPDEKTANVLRRPFFGKYQIPIITESNDSDPSIMPLDDLYISVYNGNIFLKSKSHNKFIVPRLSTAHKYTVSELPVYRFLCDLQFQYTLGNLSFHWPSIFNCFKFLPRISLGDKIILSLAVWNFSQDDIAPLLKSDLEQLGHMEIKIFQKKWKLPRYLILADGDQELFIDLNCMLTVRCFLHTVKNWPAFTVKEFLFPENNAIIDETGNSYNNQFICSVLNKISVYDALKIVKRPGSKNVKKSFSPGSEWVYLKIYCKPSIGNKFLANRLPVILNTLSRRKIMDKWFFVRFSDPDNHLRIRIHITKEKLLNQVIALFHNHTQDFQMNNLIWKVQLDTYQPEYFRYGFNELPLAENIFCMDSAMVLKMIKTGNLKDDELYLSGLLLIDKYLSSFNFHSSEKIYFLEKYRNALYAEMNIDKKSKLILDKKYRGYSNEIQSILNRNYPDNGSSSFNKIIDTSFKNISELGKRLLNLNDKALLSCPLEDLVSSVVHMSLNRLITYNPRQYELVLYDFLYRYYRSKRARESKSALILK